MTAHISTGDQLSLSQILECDQSVDSGLGIATVHGEWITERESFEQLNSEWNELFDRISCDNPFLSFDWMFTWWKHWNHKSRLAIIAIRNSRGRLVALAPFYVMRLFAGGPRRLGFLADTRVGSDYLTILAERDTQDTCLREIVRILAAKRREWDYIELSDGPETPQHAEFCECLKDTGLASFATSASVCFHISLPAKFDEYLSTVSTSLRCNFRRRWRNLQKEEHVELRVVSNVPELERYFPELLRLHRMRFKNLERDSALFERGVPEFQAEAAQALAARGWARLFLLSVNGEIVAASYGFSVQHVFSFYQCGMHPGWRNSGIGQMLIGASIRETIEAGHKDFDFLRGGESYKSGWAKDSRRTVTVRFFDRRLRSLLALSYFKLRAVASCIKACASDRKMAQHGSDKLN